VWASFVPSRIGDEKKKKPRMYVTSHCWKLVNCLVIPYNCDITVWTYHALTHAFQLFARHALYVRGASMSIWQAMALICNTSKP